MSYIDDKITKEDFFEQLQRTDKKRKKETIFVILASI